MSNSEAPDSSKEEFKFEPGWRVEEEDESKYNFSDEKGVWQPKPEDILSLFEKLADGNPLPLKWQCPGRRPPEKFVKSKEESQEEGMDVDEDNSKDEESRVPETSAFDFDEPQMEVTTKLTPRRAPGGLGRTPRTEKRVARMDNIMDSLRKQQLQRLAQREAKNLKKTRGSPTIGTPQRGRLLNFGSPGPNSSPAARSLTSSPSKGGSPSQASGETTSEKNNESSASPNKAKPALPSTDSGDFSSASTTTAAATTATAMTTITSATAPLQTSADDGKVSKAGNISVTKITADIEKMDTSDSSKPSQAKEWVITTSSASGNKIEDATSTAEKVSVSLPAPSVVTTATPAPLASSSSSSGTSATNSTTATATVTSASPSITAPTEVPTTTLVQASTTDTTSTSSLTTSATTTKADEVTKNTDNSTSVVETTPKADALSSSSSSPPATTASAPSSTTTKTTNGVAAASSTAITTTTAPATASTATTPASATTAPSMSSSTASTIPQHPASTIAPMDTDPVTTIPTTDSSKSNEAVSAVDTSSNSKDNGAASESSSIKDAEVTVKTTDVPVGDAKDNKDGADVKTDNTITPSTTTS